jgi:hypothetical protein
MPPFGERNNQNSISQEIQKRKWNWVGHTLRRPVDKIAKHALNWNPYGTRKVRRPRQTWRRSVNNEVKAAGMTCTTEEDSTELGEVAKLCYSLLLPEKFTEISQGSHWKSGSQRHKGIRKTSSYLQVLEDTFTPVRKYKALQITSIPRQMY